MARSLVLLVVLVLTGLFALINWSAFTATTPLSLGVTVVEAPLGLIMLGLLALLTVVFAAWALSMQATLLMEARRQSKELQAQRELADKAEASRFTELRAYLNEELGRLGRDSRAALQQTEATLAAQIGELDDRWSRAPSSGEVVRSSLLG